MNQKIIKNIISKELIKLEKKTIFHNKFPLSVTQYDENDVVNLLRTLTKGWPTIGTEVKKVEVKIQKLLKNQKCHYVKLRRFSKLLNVIFASVSLC